MKTILALPSTHEDLTELRLTRAQLIDAIKRRRKAIRKHRDQKGDDRCWLDDFWLYVFLNDSKPAPTKVPAFEPGLEQCKLFFVFRRADAPDPLPPDAILDRRFWEGGLNQRPVWDLILILRQIQEALKAHRDLPEQENRPRNLHDDRRLYSVLPEKMPADFRLPPRERFIGEEGGPHAGCPWFLRSHAHCSGICDIHAWGPCKPH